MISDADYQEWLLDESRESFRVMLIEADHQTGTVYLANRAWVSPSNIAYDDWVIGEPFMETELDTFSGIGDFEAINEEEPTDWLNLRFGGHECRWFYGDMSWAKSEFRAIGASLIEGVRFLGDRKFRFELFDNGQKLEKSISSTSQTLSLDVEAAVEWLTDASGVSISIVGVDAARLSWALSIDLTDSTTGASMLLKIAVSIGAYVRVDQLGNVDIIKPNGNAGTITEDDIGEQALEVTEVTPAYATTIVEMASGAKISSDTGVDTGSLNESVSYQTYLTSSSNAQTLADDWAAYHGEPKRFWEIPVVQLTDLFKIGDQITVTHSELIGSGIVARIKRSPLSSVSNVEVIV